MGKGSQQKGRRGEIELRDLLRDFGFEKVEVGAPQNYGTAPDLTGLRNIHVECKRSERLNITQAMQQATRDAERFGDGAPAVFHRRNRQGWLVTMRLCDWARLYKEGNDGGNNKPS